MLTRKMILKYRSPAVAGTLFLAGCLTAVTSIVLAQETPAKVATAQRELLLQTSQSWNGKPYTHYPSGQPQLTTLKVTIAPHTAHGTRIPFRMLSTSYPEPSHCVIRPVARL